MKACKNAVRTPGLTIRRLDEALIASLFFLWPCAADAFQIEASSENDIVVTGRRPASDVPIVDHYSTESINNLGAISIGEVIARLERRNGGRSFSILVNGRRLANISDIREIPPEALQKIDIIDRSHAGIFGLDPNSNVLNLVLKPSFNAISADASVKQPTEGAATNGVTNLRYTRIREERRLNASLSVQGAAALNARDRPGLFISDRNDALLPYRTLLPSSRSATLTSGIALPIAGISTNISVEANSTATRQITRFFNGNGTSPDVQTSAEAVVRGIIDESRSRSYQLSTTASGNLGRLSWTAEMTGARTESRTGSMASRMTVNASTSALSALLPNKFEALDVDSGGDSLTAALAGTGPLLKLPAGDVTGSVRLSRSVQRLRTRSLTNPDGSTLFRQHRSRAHAAIDLPITGSDQPIVGQTSLSANGDYEYVTGVGVLPAYDLSLSWQPIAMLSLSIGRTVTKAQPPLGRNRDPVISIPGVLVVDNTNGQNVLVTRISGGAPDLRAAGQVDQSARLNLNGSIGATALSATIEYASTAIVQPIIFAAYPTPLFQQLFPARFTRDASGRLTAIDVRPFNGTEERRKQIRSTVHAAGHFAGSDGDWDMNISHGWLLSDRLRTEVPGRIIDLLATPLDGIQGTSRMTANLDASASYEGLRLQFGSRWRQATQARDITAAQPYSIRYGPLWTIDTEISYTFRRVDHAGAAEGKPLRVWLSVENLLGRRLRVTDSNGATPPAFQQGFTDPTGRVISLRMSKVL
ncbi:hypothetical protein QLH51_04000 [Sphingomonas sp. 2R-10]|uniref:hypothetical protein n=1 Tax=Sphingomonas sp. 2R-10 TaxID=3045148 RepID=UPI0024B9A4B1|nr:hypothetical protein [Sphingomonas sp. 2R-10]MDJ0275966.1 hypothetical protein [Sphingomonas sp. 2R-10]